MRVLFVQYAGDYREAVKNLAQGKGDSYYAQQYSVEVVATIAKSGNEVATLCCLTDAPYNEMLENGVRAIGAGFRTDVDAKEILKLVKNYNPTHIVARTPIREVLNWAIQNNVETLVTLADSFTVEKLKDRIRNYRLARLLNSKGVAWVGNHGINASTSLAKIGVKANKIVPWDWPHEVTPSDYAPKTLPTQKSVWEIVFVGAITELKGIGDVLEAVAILKSEGVSVQLKAIGRGELETYINRARELKIEDRVEFLGLIPNKNIIPTMREADVVIIPSRDKYPEGFPMTIYEALCARTPIIASNHPMFREKLTDQTNALIFPSGNSAALANSIKKLTSSPDLYANFSVSAATAWNSLQIPVKWADLVNRWLSNSSIDRQWIISNTLSSGRYKQAS
ncbi:glycosyltransferase family 4 protein [Phormidium sp. CLA17]|uniref:glycosyltransferase n=1 Tax=Leptolyngbya sp. Cla-17 TaxID=2803751 RepID=UPI001492D2BE|nr:glycosyltransferase [Leptolyngbya sp. Cla-17]MBM0740983.1 glycosyltransferase family 4 protein [Leptolyngbya sp. Cla-17]